MKALTKQFGTDIATAVIESGAKDYYEVSKVVTKWADDNNKVMPTDIENLISQLVAEVNKDEGGN